MGLDDFLKRYIEGYLFEDLATIDAVPVKGGDGNLGYPVVMMCAAGIEVLGMLLDPAAPNSLGHVHFESYWKRYLYPSDLARQTAGPGVYYLGRHGVAHNFAAKSPIMVTRQVPGALGAPHLVAQPGGEIVVDATTLAKDLRDSYNVRFAPYVRGAGRSDAEAALAAIATANANKTAAHSGFFAGLPSGAATILTYSTSSYGTAPAPVPVSPVPATSKPPGS